MDSPATASGPHRITRTRRAIQQAWGRRKATRRTPPNGTPLPQPQVAMGYTLAPHSLPVDEGIQRGRSTTATALLTLITTGVQARTAVGTPAAALPALHRAPTPTSTTTELHRLSTLRGSHRRCRHRRRRPLRHTPIHPVLRHVGRTILRTPPRRAH